TEKEADVARDDYLEMIQGLTETVRPMPQNNLIDRDQDGPIPRVNVSVKLSALFSQFDPIDPEGTTNQVLKRLIPILESARKTGAFVNFDMEQYTRKDLTLSIFEKVLTLPAFRDWPDAGIAMQAYLRDTASDLKRLRDWAQKRGTSVVVRLVKGAYWDFETIQASQNHWPIPVWSKKRESDAEYERLSQFLLDNRQYLKPAFASHNIRSLSHAMAYARLRNIPDNAYEIQMLYGMADPIKEALVGLGQRVRVYTPYGELIPGMAYLVRRLLENTANDSFLRASFSDHVSEDTLLADPCQESPVLA
ncbi:MAG: proline dehydrogenase family protein, partial [Gemmataceae bacterium]